MGEKAELQTGEVAFRGDPDINADSERLNNHGAGPLPTEEERRSGAARAKWLHVVATLLLFTSDADVLDPFIGMLDFSAHVSGNDEPREPSVPGKPRALRVPAAAGRPGSAPRWLEQGGLFADNLQCKQALVGTSGSSCSVSREAGVCLAK